MPRHCQYMTLFELGRAHRRRTIPTAGSVAERCDAADGRGGNTEIAAATHRGEAERRLRRMRIEPQRSGASPLVDAAHGDATVCPDTPATSARVPASLETASGSVEPKSYCVVPFPVANSDFGLVAAIRANHPEAVGKLCSRHSGEMLQIALGVLGPDPQVEPIVRDTLRDALERIEDLSDARALRAWLVARLVAALRRRLHVRHKLRWLFRSPSSKWSADIGYSERLLATYRILDRMDTQQRILFSLVVIHTMQFSEVAKILGLSLPAAENAMDSAHASFLRHSRGEMRGLSERRFYFLSLGSEITSEQQRVLRGRNVHELDLRRPVSNRTRRFISWAAATATIAVVLMGAIGRKLHFS